MGVIGKAAQGFVSSQIRRKLGRVIRINGSDPWDPQISNPDAFFERVATRGMLGLGDSFVRGEWDVRDIRDFFIRAMNAGLLEMVADSKAMKILRKRQKEQNLQGNIKTTIDMLNAHYDMGNNLFLPMLRHWMTYTRDEWKNPLMVDDGESQKEAQERKLDGICRKLCLRQGQRLIDIGAGWGPLSGYAARKYGVKVVAVTPVPQQANYIRETYGADGVEVLQIDYRQIPKDIGKFDAVAGVGLTEHIGRQNFPVLMETINRLLMPDGLALLHFFGRTSDDVPLIDPWTEKYIFQGAYLPTLQEVLSAAEPFFGISDVDEKGIHYDKTLVAWDRNFRESWETVIKPTFRGSGQNPDEFYRMWIYYLGIAAAGFNTRKLWHWQIVFQPRHSQRFYECPR